MEKKFQFSKKKHTHIHKELHSYNMPEAAVKTSKMSNEMQEFAISTANDAIKNQWNEQVQHITTREKILLDGRPHLPLPFTQSLTHKPYNRK